MAYLPAQVGNVFVRVELVAGDQGGHSGNSVHNIESSQRIY